MRQKKKGTPRKAQGEGCVGEGEAHGWVRERPRGRGVLVDGCGGCPKSVQVQLSLTCVHANPRFLRRREADEYAAALQAQEEAEAAGDGAVAGDVDEHEYDGADAGDDDEAPARR